MARPLTPPPLSTATLDTDFTRSDIEFLGVDHSGSSYEGRVYVNNPDADETTERTPEAGYPSAPTTSSATEAASVTAVTATSSPRTPTTRGGGTR